MEFAYPAFLYAFLVLLIPIIIHLFNFRRYKTLYFSSLQFLKKIDQQTKSVKQLKNWLVLALRLLAFSLLVLAFAQPYIPGKKAGKKGSSGAMAVYIDNSFSMSAMGTNGSLLNQSKELVRELTGKVQPGTNFLLVTDDLKGKESRLIRKTDVIDQIDKIDYTANSKPIKSVINFMNTALDEQFVEGSRQFILISDFQKFEDDFAGLKLDTSAFYYPFKVVPQSYDNLYIDSVWFTTPLRRVNNPNELNIRVVNTSENELSNVSLNLSIGKINRDILVDLPAQSSEVFQINYSNASHGLKHGKVEISDDQLFFDDILYFSYEVNEDIKVMIINGDDAANYPKRVFDTDKMFTLKEVNIKQLQLSDINEKDLIVLNELNEIPSALTSKIKEFTAAGGKVLVIPGKEISLVQYNQLISQFNLPQFGELVKNQRRLTNIAYDEMFFNGMFSKKSQNLNLPKIKQLYKPKVSTQSNYSNLISFEDELPFFTTNTGEENIFVFYAGTDEKFGNLSNHAIFVATLLRVGGLSQSKNELFATLGSELAYKLPVQVTSLNELKIITNDTEFIPQVQNKSGRSFILLDQELIENLKAGNHKIEYKDEVIDVLSVNYNRSESVFETYTENNLIEQFKSLGANNIQVSSFEDMRDIGQLSLEKPAEYWRILLILALICLLLEIVVLKFWKL